MTCTSAAMPLPRVLITLNVKSSRMGVIGALTRNTSRGAGVEERRHEVRRGRQPPLMVGNRGEPQSGDTIQANNLPNVALRTCPAMLCTRLRTSACRDVFPVARYTF